MTLESNQILHFSFENLIN